jgi:hypothetical protein
MEASVMEEITKVVERIIEIKSTGFGDNPKLSHSYLMKYIDGFPITKINKTFDESVFGTLFGYPLVWTKGSLTTYIMCQSCHTIGGGVKTNLLGEPACCKCGAPI